MIPIMATNYITSSKTSSSLNFIYNDDWKSFVQLILYVRQSNEWRADSQVDRAASSLREACVALEKDCI